MAEAINDMWVPNRRYGGVNKGAYVLLPKTGAIYGLSTFGKKFASNYFTADELQ